MPFISLRFIKIQNVFVQKSLQWTVDIVYSIPFQICYVHCKAPLNKRVCPAGNYIK